MDGVCAGVAAIVCLFFAVLAMLSGQVLVSTLAAAVMGAALGFLRWNFSPAKIFMGDGGAMLLGFLVATLALKLRVSARALSAAWLVPVLVLAVPIFDTTLVSISRLRRGLLPFTTPGKDHAATGWQIADWVRVAPCWPCMPSGISFRLLAILSTHLNSVQTEIFAAIVLVSLLVPSDCKTLAIQRHIEMSQGRGPEMLNTCFL